MRTLIAACLCLLAAPLAAVPVALADPAPRPGDVRLIYGVHVGGIHVLDAEAHLGMSGDSYRIGVKAATDGFLGRVARWEADIVSHGRLAAGRLPAPILYRSVSAFRDEPRNTTVEYGADGRPLVTLAEPPPDRDREPVPDRLKPDTIDPMSALVAVLHAVAEGRGCGVTAPVYDGRQRYDLTFTPEGAESLPPSDLSAFSGPAERCAVSFKPLAGAWREQDRRRDRDDDRGSARREVHAWFATPSPGAPPVLVRLETSSPLGAVMVHLASIRQFDPGDAAPVATP